MRERRSPLYLTAFTLLAMGSSSMAYQFQFQAGAGETPGWLNGAQFGRVLAGDLTGDRELDAVVMAGDRVTLLEAPEVHQTNAPIAEVAHDFDLLRGGGSGGADSVIQVGPGGLRSASWSGAPGGWVSSSIDASAWIDARHVRVGDLDGVNGDDIVGLGEESVDDRLILIQYADGLGGYDPGTSIQTVFPAYGLELMDYDGDGEKDLAALTGWGLEVYDRAGTPLYNYPWSYSELIPAVMRAPGGSHDQIALIAGNFAPPQYLVVTDKNGLVGPFGIGPAGAVRMSAIDLDLDGDDDLAITVQSETSAWLLENLSGGPGPLFDPLTALLKVPIGDPNRAPSANSAGIAGGDVDRDGDIDLICPITGDNDGEPIEGNEVASGIAVVRNLERDHAQYFVEFESSVYKHYALPEPPLVLEPDGELTLFLEAPELLLELDEPEDTRKLRIEVWSTPDLGVATSSTTHFAEDIDIPEENAPLEERRWSFFTGQSDSTFLTLHTLEIRQIVIDGHGAVIEKSPASTTIYATQDNLFSVSMLPTVSFVQMTTFTTNQTQTQEPPPDPITGGGLCSHPPAPPFDESDVPN